MLRVISCCRLAFCVLALPLVASANVPDKQPVAALKPGRATWAHIVVKGNYPEEAQMLGLFGEVVESLSDGIARLDKAANDDKISGIILRLKNPTIGWAKQNEFLQAIARIQANGKKVYAWLDSASSVGYMLASSCDEIIMPESGVLMLTGLRAEVSFYKNLFDTLSIKADMLRIGEFKSAGEPYTRSEMSPAFRQEMESLLDDMFGQMVETISKGRKLDRDHVEAAIDAGPLTVKAAKELGLIDHVAYADEVKSLVKGGNNSLDLKITHRYGRKKLDTDFSGFAGMMKMMNLMMGVEPRGRRSYKPKIAVIHASGVIVTGRSSSGGLFGGTSLGSETLVKAIRKANQDSKVKAIVLRVDSPGGSAMASDLIWRALEQVDKPLIASMGDVAASGGYYISMGADRIFAEPGTITGSIGVVGGKFALKGLYEKIGITTNIIQRGKNSGALSALDGFTDSEREAMMTLLHEIYDQFTRKAAQGRKMTQDDLKKLAGGRVYTGNMALKNGLVDELGTLEDAVAYAKRAAGLKPGAKIDRMILPKPASPFEQLFGPIDSDARMNKAPTNALIEALGGLSPEAAEHLKAVHIVNLLAREIRLTLMPFRLIVK